MNSSFSPDKCTALELNTFKLLLQLIEAHPGYVGFTRTLVDRRARRFAPFFDQRSVCRCVLIFGSFLARLDHVTHWTT